LDQGPLGTSHEGKYLIKEIGNNLEQWVSIIAAIKRKQRKLAEENEKLKLELSRLRTQSNTPTNIRPELENIPE